jgi:hypothetical protein
MGIQFAVTSDAYELRAYWIAAAKTYPYPHRR